MNQMFHAEELAFQTAIRVKPMDTTARLVYADWLEENGRSEQSAFLRLTATTRALLVDGDSEAERDELIRCIDLRTQLRRQQKLLDAVWLKAIGEPYFVGQVLVHVTHFWGNRAYFGIIVKQTAKTVIVAELQKRRITGDSQEGEVRPLLPNSDQFTIMTSGPIGMRCQIGSASFNNHRANIFYDYWDGKTRSECCD